ncbi:MAG: carbohydrate ABC transporter substrate-binding protein [Frankia sp.]|nr:carbohydrate ABC transporter substrate-binding protein [Frankia sp.]
MRAHRGRYAAMAGALALVTALAATACGSDDEEGSGGGDGETITLTFNNFGVFGYEEAGLFAEFEASHPGVKIQQSVSEYNTHHNNLINHLAAGSGAADIEAVDEGFLAQLKATPEQFVNLLEMPGGPEREADYPEGKWAMSLGADGSQIGLGTDVGGLGMCYRPALFEQAGLPTGRDEVSALWPTWDAYFEVGDRFTAANTGATWFDAGTNIYNAQVFQLEEAYYAPNSDELIVADNPGVKAAFDKTAAAIQRGQSGKLVAFEEEWATAMRESTFATLVCPAWMMGYIKENAASTEGTWDIASVPGGGGGNWGGSWLTIPAQSEHKDLAWELINFLTQPESQIKVFQAVGNMPSTVEAVESDAVQGFVDPFFNNAPVGAIFGGSALKLTPQFQGEKHGPIRQALEQGIQRIEQTNQDPAEAFQQSLEDVERVSR